MEYHINLGVWGDIFAVPKSVADNYLKLANEASLKVLLYVLRNGGQPLNSERISAALNISEESVEEAFVFWEKADVLVRPENAVKQTVKPAEVQASAAEKPAEVHRTKRSVEKGTGYNLNPSEISDRVNKSEEIRCLFTMSESTFGRPLTHTEQRSLIWMHDYLGLATDVLLMLIAYCMSIGKESVRYIETIASSWAENGINTLETAQAEVKSMEERRSFNGKIMRIFGMSRKPTTKQQGFIDLWREKEYSLELIEYAYEKTIETIEKLNFSYINKILENWQANGLTSRETIDASDSKRREEKSSLQTLNADDYKFLVNNFGD